VLFALTATVHELAHLAAARSLGVPARIGLSTRLFYLVAQTDVSGIWAAPRRARYRELPRWDRLRRATAVGGAAAAAHAGFPAVVTAFLRRWR
jgi:hypothetical protein